MSKRAEALTLRLARPDEHDELEELQRRASLELPEYRDQLLSQSRRDPSCRRRRSRTGRSSSRRSQARSPDSRRSSAASSTACSSSRTCGAAESASALIEAAAHEARRRGLSADGARKSERAAFLRELRLQRRRRGADALRAGPQDVDANSAILVLPVPPLAFAQPFDGGGDALLRAWRPVWLRRSIRNSRAAPTAGSRRARLWPSALSPARRRIPDAVRAQALAHASVLRGAGAARRQLGGLADHRVEAPSAASRRPTVSLPNWPIAPSLASRRQAPARARN